jgi:hypothetical protein
MPTQSTKRPTFVERHAVPIHFGLVFVICPVAQRKRVARLTGPARVPADSGSVGGALAVVSGRSFGDEGRVGNTVTRWQRSPDRLDRPRRVRSSASSYDVDS